MLAPSLLVLTAQPAEAQAPGDPWWGPSSRDAPTDGWAVRIPVVVENNRTYALRNHPVAVELDFTKLLLDAGWTSQSVGAEARLRGFTLDVDSIRVVEYQRGFSPGPLNGQTTEPTPHAFYPALLTGARTRDFDASRNPAGTVMFTVDSLAPAEKRYFYVYANPLEFGKMQPAKFDLAKSAPLDAYLWGSSGTVVYGYEPAQSNQNHRVHVSATTVMPTTVTVYTYNVGRFQPLAATTSFPNPVRLSGGGPMSASFLVPAGTPYKIVADHPIMAAAHGNGQQIGTTGMVGSTETFGYVPAVDTQNFLGRDFYVYGFRGSPTGVPGNVIIIKSGPGSVDVRALGSGATATLTAANPIASLRVANGWDRIRATGDVLVALNDGSTTGEFQAHEVPALTGGPLGTEFYVRVPRDAGQMRICAEANMTLRIVDLSTPARQLMPEGPFDTTPAARLAPVAGCHLERANAAYPDGTYVDLFSTREPVDPVPGSPVPFRLSVGAGARQNNVETRPHVGPYGGYQGNDYYVEGAVGLFGHFPDTKVVVTEYRTKGDPLTYTVSLPEDGFLQLTARAGGDSARRYHLEGVKPFTAVSTESTITPKYPSGHSYGFMLGGRPLTLPVEVGTPQFRGPLVDLRSAEGDSRQIFRATGPATKTEFKVQALNLGRWIGGENLPAEVQLTCEDVPLTWKVEGCDQTMRLNSREAADITIGVTPSEEDVDETRTILVTARSAGSNVTAQLRLIVFVEIRYGVGMWFDVEGGRKSIEPAIGLNPAETYRYNILLKNTGSSPDRFELTVEPPRAGWTQQLLRDGVPVTAPVELGNGESTMLQFVVTAPDAETAQQNIVRITAQSLSNALAADVVNTATRIRPKIDVRLELDPPTRVAKPNETAVFNLTLRNEGNDIFTIRLREDSILPEGWTSEIRLPNHEVSLNPQTSVNVPLLLTPPPGALAGDLAASKITAEIDIGDGGGAIRGDEVGAVVVVRKLNNVSVAYDTGVATESGTTLVYPVTIGNDGNGDELVELLPGASEPRWRLSTSVPDLRVPVNGSVDVDLQIDVPANATPGLYNYTFTVRLSREAFQNLTIPLEVLPTAKLDFRGIEDLNVLPGQARRLQATVVNIGNVEGEFVFATEAPEGWNVTFEPAGATLLPGESRRVQVSVNASRGSADGAYRLTFKADGSDAVSGNRTVAASLGRPDLYVEGVETNGRPRAGDLLLVTATLGNRGDVAAEDVQVALVIDGLVVDQVTVSRVPVGESTIARLSWLATGTPGTVSVRIDPANAIVETSRDENEALVQFGSRLTPMPGAFALLAAAGAAVLLASRRRSQ